MNHSLQFRNNTKFQKLSEAIMYVNQNFHVMVVDNTIALALYFRLRNRLAILNGLATKYAANMGNGKLFFHIIKQGELFEISTMKIIQNEAVYDDEVHLSGEEA